MTFLYINSADIFFCTHDYLNCFHYFNYDNNIQ